MDVLYPKTVSEKEHPAKSLQKKFLCSDFKPKIAERVMSYFGNDMHIFFVDMY